MKKQRSAVARRAPQRQQEKQWDAKFYETKHAVVWKAAADLIDQLAPQLDERILDLGCGTGQLAAKITSRGAHVIGIDRSPEMIAQAQENFPGLWFEVGDATTFRTTHPFDAIFSNATLHWIKRPTDTIARVWDALRPGGRFVAEMGGKGNVGRIIAAAQAALVSQGRLLFTDDSPWFFPSVAEYATLLEDRGFEVSLIQLFDRPTKLEGDTGLRDWITGFATHFVEGLDERQCDAFFARLEEILRPTLFQNGAWMADYRRLRFVAIKPGGST
ncbi:MAG: methyltransferase domain-containing protein [Tepidisphaeraceae bacterium]